MVSKQPEERPGNGSEILYQVPSCLDTLKSLPWMVL